jgi:hypothetical protein
MAETGNGAAAGHFEQYRVHHLFLLVGGNPLPNYVAARLLCRDGGTIHLLHSVGSGPGAPALPRGTEAVAERLQQALKKTDLNLQFSFIPVDENDGRSISAALSKDLGEISDGRIGLNFTGGTKAMSAYAFMTFKDHFNDMQNNHWVSYMDAETPAFYFDYGTGRTQQVDISKDDLQIDIKTHTLLHLGAEPIVDPEPWPPTDLRKQLLDALVEIHSSERSSWRFKSWLAANFNATLDIRDLVWEGDACPADLKNILSDYLTNNTLRDKATNFLAAFESPSNRLQQEWKKYNPKTKDADLPWELIKMWFGSLWLEDYAFSQVRELQKEGLVFEVGNIHTQSLPRFEADVVATAGHRLFLISCGTSAVYIKEKSGTDVFSVPQKDLKLKLFEAKIRAKQLGGSEASVGLVCLLPRGADSLAEEVKDPWRSPMETKVFGMPSLRRLKGELSKWIGQTVGD